MTQCPDPQRATVVVFSALVCAIPFALRLSEYFCRKLRGRREGRISQNSFIVGVENPAKYSARCFLWHNCPFEGSCSSAFQFSNESSTGCVHMVQDEWMWRNLDHHLGWWDTNQLLFREQSTHTISQNSFYSI